MALTDKDIKKLSHLAKINISSDDELIVLKKTGWHYETH